MKNFVLLTVALLVMSPSLLLAQPDPPGGPVPVDGAVGLLALAGAALGAYKQKIKA